MKKIDKALKKLKKELAKFYEDEPVTITMQSATRKEDIEVIF